MSINVVYYWIDRGVIRARRLNAGMPVLDYTQRNRRTEASRLGTQLMQDSARHPQRRLEEVHYEITVGMPSFRTPPSGFGISTRFTGCGL